jgi:hypothetical protein
MQIVRGPRGKPIAPYDPFNLRLIHCKEDGPIFLPDNTRCEVCAVRRALDPLKLLEEIRAVQAIARQGGEYRHPLPTISRSVSQCFLRYKLPERARDIQKQPIICGGMIGGIGARRSHETAEIPDLFYTISNPSRGAIKYQ